MFAFTHPQFLYDGEGGGAGLSADVGDGDGLYAEHLASVPEDQRDLVEPILKAWDAKVTPKFMEAAEYRKQWEKFEPLSESLLQVDPDDLQQLLEFREMAQDEDAFMDWYTQVGEQMGLNQAPPAADGEPDISTPEGIQAMIEAKVKEGIEQGLTPFQQQQQEVMQQAQLEQVASQLEEQFDSIVKEHEIPDEDHGILANFAVAHQGEEDPLAGALKDYQGFLARTERNFLEGKLKAPKAALSGGVPDTTAKKPTSYAEAEKIARSMMSGGQ